MKAKKHTIIFSGLIALASIFVYAILHFRLYHLLGISGTGQGLLTNLRDFFIVISSGLFTSACVTLIISIHEYIDASWIAMRNLKRQLYDIRERFRNILWYDPEIDYDVLKDYFQHKYRISTELFKKDIKIHNENGLELPPVLLEFIEEEQAIVSAFREQIWEHRLKSKFENIFTEETKELYLDKALPYYEDEIENRTTEFIESLQTLRYYDIYQLQAACDEIDFLFSKRKTNLLCTMILTSLIPCLDVIKCELQKISTRHTDKMQMLYSLYILNNTLTMIDDNSTVRYSVAEFRIAIINNTISNLLTPHKSKAPPPKADFSIYRYHYLDTTYDIFFDSEHN